MKMYFGITLLVLAVMTSVVPQYNTCEYHGKLITLASGATIPMKCTYSAKAEIAAGVPLFAIGALLVVSRRRETAAFLSAAGGVLGILVMLIPSSLIGVCSSLMPCNTFMRPFLLATGLVVVAVSATAFVASWRRRESV